jgi:hypothetical protein
MTNPIPKRCFKCDQIKPITEFYKHPQMGDGHLGKCKECTKRDASEHREKNHAKVCAYDRSRFKDPVRKAKVRMYSKRSRDRDNRKAIARLRVARAVKSGKIRRPETCSLCGCAGRIEAHHHDYDKPLEVSWLCFKCHRTHGHGQRVEV